MVQGLLGPTSHGFSRRSLGFVERVDRLTSSSASRPKDPSIPLCTIQL